MTVIAIAGLIAVAWCTTSVHAQAALTENPTRADKPRQRQVPDADRLLDEVRELRRDVERLTERLRLRDLQPKIEPAAQVKYSSLESKLSKRVTVDFEEVPLQTALAELAKQVDIELFIEPRGMEEAGVTSTRAITMCANGVTCRSTLKLLLRQFNLQYVDRDGGIVVTSAQRAQSKTSTTRAKLEKVPEVLQACIYDVSDLVIHVSGSGNNAKAAGKKYLKKLIDRIKESTGSSTWDDAGRRCSLAVDEQHSLIVWAPGDIHEQIAVLLRHERRELNVEICVEFYWLPTVEKKLFEKANLGIVWNEKTRAAKLSAQEANRLFNSLPVQDRSALNDRKIIFCNRQHEELALDDLYRPTQPIRNNVAGIPLYLHGQTTADHKCAYMTISIDPTGDVADHSELVANGDFVLFDITNKLYRERIGNDGARLLVVLRMLSITTDPIHVNWGRTVIDQDLILSNLNFFSNLMDTRLHR